MTQEDRELLLKDLCARSPYGVKFKADNEEYIREIHYIRDENVYIREYRNLPYWIDIVKPYLRPMSSMTKEEKYIYRHMLGATLNSEGESIMFVYEEDFSIIMDWLNKKMFDYRGLIEKGIALEALEGMYKDN